MKRNLNLKNFLTSKILILICGQARKPQKNLKLIVEIENGETTINIDAEGNVVRETNVVIFDVVATEPETGKKYRLREAEQVFADGSKRVREYQGVSEKIKRDETPEEATVRGLMEELQLNTGYEITKEVSFEETKMKSTSYPGLESKQKVYRTSVVMTPEIFRATKETGFVEKQLDENGDWIKTTTLVWEEII